ncbi:MAG: hypothetical protein FWH33_06505 [Oscillospiraceae bacterium]|nr:hypothetical protein [Oscillospiraceae bacterium]
MPLVEYTQGSLICNEGEPLQNLSFIAKGRVEASLNGHLLTYEKGDMLGVQDLCTGIYSLTYIAITDTAVITDTYGGIENLETLMHSNSDAAILIIDAVCRKAADCLQYRASLEHEAAQVFNLATDVIAQYEQLCSRYAFASKQLPGIAELEQFTDAEPAEEWLADYYSDLKDMDAAARKAFFHGNTGLSYGFFSRGLEDLTQAIQSCMEYQDYIKNVSALFLADGEYDIFSLITDLHVNSAGLKDADAAIEPLIARLTKALQKMTGIDRSYYNKRLDAYKKLLEGKRAAIDASAPEEAAGSAEGAKQNLVGSLDAILEYSGCDVDVCSEFARLVRDYTELSDRGSSEENASSTRRELTKKFYGIYNQVFIKSINDPTPPTIINMFLNFGYVDAKLAGYDNADYLYSIADSFKGDPEAGIFTLREWMTAVYEGQKEPSRSEFDMDYTEYLRNMKNEGTIDAKEETRLLADTEGKLRYEMENAFPVVNRITSGAVSLFCPVFSDQNVQRRPDASLVRPEALKSAIDEIRSLDFSAFYRETAYVNRPLGITDNFISVEVLPEIILMPNIGTRGIMWQEIAGKVRTTPSRMFMPLFLQTDMKSVVIQLTAEFRWEMCKRIQGARWGDVTDPSLTSEYCDYLQFYKTNRELSQEIKAAIKTELTRARNNYKTVYVSNYADWLQYEAKGMQRLNKAACRLLFLYCPFPAEIREKLIQTIPRYADLSKRFTVKQHQRIKLLSNIIQKIEVSGKKVPQELRDELEHAKR